MFFSNVVQFYVCVLYSKLKVKKTKLRKTVIYCYGMVINLNMDNEYNFYKEKCRQLEKRHRREMLIFWIAILGAILLGALFIFGLF